MNIAELRKKANKAKKNYKTLETQLNEALKERDRIINKTEMFKKRTKLHEQKKEIDRLRACIYVLMKQSNHTKDEIQKIIGVTTGVAAYGSKHIARDLIEIINKCNPKGEL